MDAAPTRGALGEASRCSDAARSERSRLGVVGVIGRGRVGSCFARILRERGHRVIGPLGREFDRGELAGADSVVLCVPDRSLAEAAASVPAGVLAGHCSGARGLEPLGRRRAFSLHPLMTVTGAGDQALAEVPAAVAGSDREALDHARALASALEMRPFTVPEGDRVAYHAAASVSSNLIMPLLQFADELAESAHVPRDVFAPLVTRAVANWAAHGAHRALTGPVARGDADTVRAQRDAVGERLPERLDLFDALVAETEALSARGAAHASH